MAKDLRTGWKRIGRSGPTVDGRVIKPEMIRESAANYKKELFTALIWPEHFRYINLGTVEELRAEDNEEGGVDLFAILSPNEFYLQANHAGQKLFTSMELTPDFRKTGQWYLTGLAATDDPASAATTEMRLSASAKPGAFSAKLVEIEDHQFNDYKPSFLERLAVSLFKTQPSEDDAMADNKEIEKLNAELADLKQKFAALKPPADDKKPDDKPGEQFNQLVDKVAEAVAARFGKKEEKPDDKKESSALEEQFAKLGDRLVDALAKFTKADGKDGKTQTEAEQLKDLQTQFKALQDKLDAAMKEQQGTNGGEHLGSDEKLDDYL